MKLKNGEIDVLIEFLYNMNLRRKESRMRTRMIKLLAERYKDVIEEKNEIYERYAKKDEDDNIMFDPNTKQIIFKDEESEQKALEEYLELMNEDCVIDQTEERKDMLITVRDAVLNYDDDEYFKDMRGEKAVIYDRICEIVEQINYEE